jgi:hypothetical protein
MQIGSLEASRTVCTSYSTRIPGRFCRSTPPVYVSSSHHKPNGSVQICNPTYTCTSYNFRLAFLDLVRESRKIPVSSSSSLRARSGSFEKGAFFTATNAIIVSKLPWLKSDERHGSLFWLITLNSATHLIRFKTDYPKKIRIHDGTFCCNTYSKRHAAYH